MLVVGGVVEYDTDNFVVQFESQLDKNIDLAKHLKVSLHEAKQLKKLTTLWEQSIAPVSFKNNVSLFIFCQTFYFSRKSTRAINCS